MDDLISEFITETSESLQVLDSALVKLEQDPSNSAILSNIFRLVHTIKGTCGFLGLPRLEAVAHASEDVLGKIRDKVITASPQIVSVVLESIDSIKSIIEHLSQHEAEPAGDDAELIARLNAFAEPVAAATHVSLSPAPTPEATAPPAQPVAEIMPPVQIAMPMEKPAGADNTDLARRARETAIAEGLAAEPAARETTNMEGAQTIRVTIEVLESLMQMVGELVLTRNQLLQIVKTRNDPLFAAPLQHLSHITSELQEGVMKTRMQPIGNAWSKFPRLIRDLSHELGKKIDLRMMGQETELDRQLLEMIKDPLTHMVRNSADHGLETPVDRRAAGKGETGVVTLSAFHEGGHIIIEISDDGRGLHLERIKQKALANGMASESELASISDQQLMQFIFRAGFSTAEKVTSVSGRGVGMDVVRNNIEKIGGTIELHSVFGKGSKFTIKIPLTLAIVSVLIVEAGGQRFALPQISVQKLIRVSSDSPHAVEYINNAPVLRLRDTLLPLVPLVDVLAMKKTDKPGRNGEQFVVVCRVGTYSFGVIIDRVFDMEEIVVKPVSKMLRHIPLYSGTTILGDGKVILILDPNGLARTTGEKDITGGQHAMADLHRAAAVESTMPFLLFKSGEGAPKAVPLELVSRLEEIDLGSLERSGEYFVVQYRGDLMRMRSLSGPLMPEAVKKGVIIFTYDHKMLGLVVDEIMDIVNAPYAIQVSTVQEGLLGSMIVEGKATDIVDVAYLLKDIVTGQDAPILSAIPKKSGRLLLIDDSPFFRNLTQPFLTSAGYHVTAVSSAREAMEQLESKAVFDGIISDIEMPEIDGFAFAQWCRAQPKLMHIPLFAFTSDKSDKCIQRGKQAGFHDVIGKTERAELLHAVDEALHRMQKETV